MIQNEALEILKTGKSVFLTGEPGSGKTYLINEYISWLREHEIEPATTASTGIAATHIGGMTVHSWSGIGVSDRLSPEDLRMILGRNKVRKRVETAKVLIIDEVSMLSGATLSMVDLVCRAIRENAFPFGGMQVLLVGDFFQLPPIGREGQKIPFAYESDAWQRLNPECCYLKDQYRQDDPEFLSILSAIRRNSCSETHRDLLNRRIYLKSKVADDIPKLFPHNADVDRINTEKLAKLPGKLFSFYMEAQGSKPLVEILKKSCLSPEVLELKIGASVIFTKNSRDGKYVNGTLGIVIGFDRESEYPIVQTRSGQRIFAGPMEWTMEESGKILARVAQIPLRLAWAITVHKSQGMSMDEAVMDLSGAFEYGQGYVALSRVRKLSGLYLLGLNERALEVHPEVFLADTHFREKSEQTLESFRGMNPKDLFGIQEDFIQKCGGSVVSKEYASSLRERISTYDVTREFILQNMLLEKIALERNLAVGTIVSHLEKLVEKKCLDPHQELLYLKPEAKRFEKIKTALEDVLNKDGRILLSPAREILGDDFSFEELRLARLFLR